MGQSVIKTKRQKKEHTAAFRTCVQERSFQGDLCCQNNIFLEMFLLNKCDSSAQMQLCTIQLFASDTITVAVVSLDENRNKFNKT